MLVCLRVRRRALCWTSLNTTVVSPPHKIFSFLYRKGFIRSQLEFISSPFLFLFSFFNSQRGARSFLLLTVQCCIERARNLMLFGIWLFLIALKGFDNLFYNAYKLKTLDAAVVDELSEALKVFKAF